MPPEQIADAVARRGHQRRDRPCWVCQPGREHRSTTSSATCPGPRATGRGEAAGRPTPSLAETAAAPVPAGTIGPPRRAGSLSWCGDHRTRDGTTRDGTRARRPSGADVRRPTPSRELVQPEVVERRGRPAPTADGEVEGEQVTQPTKLIRIASMVRTMLDEVRRAPLDDAGRRRLREIHEKSIHELEGVLSPDLRRSSKRSSSRSPSDTPTESELRLAQAQLVGWLEGLFHGIQATLFTQQAMAQGQLEEMRRRRALEVGRRAAGHRPAARPAATSRPAEDRAMTTAPLFGNEWTTRRSGARARPPSSPTGPTPPRSRRRSTSSAAMPPLVFAGEARTLTEAARRRARRAGVPARRRGLRRVVRRVLRRRHPRQAQDHPADVGRPDLRQRRADAQGRAHGRAVLEAALVADRDARRRRAAVASGATSSTTSRSTRRPAVPIRRRLVARLPPVGVDAEPRPRVHQGRVRRPLPRARVEPGVRRCEPRGRALRGARRRDRAGAAVHGRVRHRPRTPSSSCTRSTSGPRTRRCSSATRRR